MKRILIFCLIVFSIVDVFSQAENLRFGFTASPGISWWKPDNSQHSSGGARFGLDYGVLLDYKFGNNERYAIGTGLILTLDGGKLVSEGTEMQIIPGQGEGEPDDTIYKAGKVALTGKLQHIQIPLTLKLRSNEIGYITYYGAFGVIPSFTIRRRVDFDKTLDGVSVLAGDNDDFKNVPFYPNTIKNVNPFNFGLNFEAGLEYSVSDNTSLVGGLYFTNGFVNQLDDDDKERVATRNFGIRIGVLF
ncbi:MAG: PorT family protein [Chitinophagales bacterium]|nr:PorT family protein [Chitinophagales bacterium]